MKEAENKKDYNFHEEILRNKTLLAMIALSAVQSSTWTLIHNAKNKKDFKFSRRNFMKQNITSNDRSFGCPIVYADANPQSYFVRRHLNKA